MVRGGRILIMGGSSCISYPDNYVQTRDSSSASGSLKPLQEAAPEGDIVWVVTSVTQSIERVTYLV